MTKIVTVEQMRSIEKAADASGLTYDLMMDQAGLSVRNAIIARLGDVGNKRILVLVGTGNNGGDGLVAANHLADDGAEISIYLSKPRPSDDSRIAPLLERKIFVATAEDDQRSKVLRLQAEKADIIVDALLGTGIKLPLKGSIKTILQTVQKVIQSRDQPPWIVAVDCPSGLDCDTGEIGGETIRADLTVTLAAAKTGQFRFPGAAAVGELIIGDIGLDPGQAELSEVKLDLADRSYVRNWLPKRPINAHKGTFGRLLVVAGSSNYPGAAVLAAQGAYRIGTGLVTLAVPASIQPIAGPQIPEATWLLLPHDIGVIAKGAEEVLLPELQKAQALLIGPGFGLEETTQSFLERLLKSSTIRAASQIGFSSGSEIKPGVEFTLPPCVFDADGLRLLSKINDWEKRMPPDSILTPHPGEMAFMTGEEVKTIQRYRVESAKHWAATWGHVVVLKGAFTVVASADRRAALLPFANPVLARAGTGDVLAGMIAGLRAQGVEAFEAAVLGAYLHARAGELAEKGIGFSGSVVAGDLTRFLPQSVQELREG